MGFNRKFIIAQRKLYNYFSDKTIKGCVRRWVRIGGNVFCHRSRISINNRNSCLSSVYLGHPVCRIFCRFRMWATLLNALASSTNFILYYLLCPCFLVHLKHMLLPQRIIKRNYARRPRAYFNQQSGGKAKCEIFVL